MTSSLTTPMFRHSAVLVFWLCCTIEPTLAVSSVARTALRRKGSCDDLTCSVTMSWNFGGPFSRLQCSVKCSRQIGCYGIFHNSDDGSCTGVGDLRLPNPSTCQVSPGSSRFYTLDGSYDEPCVNTSQCYPAGHNLVCSGGLCKCVDFYNRVPDKGVCVAACDVYGDSFETYPGIYIVGMNMDFKPLTTPETCQKFCRGNNRCLSCEWGPSDKTCHIAETTLYLLPEALGNNPANAEYYQRNCD